LNQEVERQARSNEKIRQETDQIKQKEGEIKGQLELLRQANDELVHQIEQAKQEAEQFKQQCESALQEILNLKQEIVTGKQENQKLLEDLRQHNQFLMKICEKLGSKGQSIEEIMERLNFFLVQVRRGRDYAKKVQHFCLSIDQLIKSSSPQFQVPEEVDQVKTEVENNDEQSKQKGQEKERELKRPMAIPSLSAIYDALQQWALEFNRLQKAKEQFKRNTSTNPKTSSNQSFLRSNIPGEEKSEKEKILEVPYYRLIKHICKIFDISDVSQVKLRMDDVFITLNDFTAAFNVIKRWLDLDPRASIEIVLKALKPRLVSL